MARLTRAADSLRLAAKIASFQIRSNLVDRLAKLPLLPLYSRRSVNTVTTRHGSHDPLFSKSIRDKFGSMRGVSAKVAQMVSYVDTRVSQQTRDALSIFQDNAEPMPWKVTRTVLEESFGEPVAKVFKYFEETPFAAASIGQVHKAILKSGEEVAVKVQYPDIREIISSDLKNAQSLSQLLRIFFPAMDIAAMTEEISTRILEEVDYLHEAEVQQLFHNYYDGHPTIYIPKVLTKYTTGQVLTTEFVSGKSFGEFLDASDTERNLAGETIFRFVFHSLYRLNAFNGDPHPGNYLFLGNGRVAFLDFGFTRTFTPEEMADFMDMVKFMVVEPNPAKFRRTIERAGLLAQASEISDFDVTEYFRDYYEVIKERGVRKVDQEYANRLISHSFDRRSKLSRFLNVPKSFVVVQRINLGMYAILAQLGSATDWRSIAEEVWPFVSAPPNTDMGRAEQEWLKSLKIDRKPDSS